MTGCWVNNVYMGIFGYSDDNLLTAPSLDSLQEYAIVHNLKFRTNADPRNCKTKCIAFLNKERELGPVELGGVPLPWVYGGLHLDNIAIWECYDFIFNFLQSCEIIYLQ